MKHDNHHLAGLPEWASEEEAREAAEAIRQGGQVRPVRDDGSFAAKAKAEAEAAERAKAEREAAAFRADFEAALEPTRRALGVVYDAEGRRVARLPEKRVATEGRLSMLSDSGWSEGGTKTVRSEVLVTEDGRRLETGEWVVSTDGDGNHDRDRIVEDGADARIAGLGGRPKTPATSEWLPAGAARPKRSPLDCTGRYKGQSDAEDAWEEAEEAAKRAEAERKEAARAAAKARAEAREKERARKAREAANPFAALAALKGGGR